MLPLCLCSMWVYVCLFVFHVGLFMFDVCLCMFLFLLNVPCVSIYVRCVSIYFPCVSIHVPCVMSLCALMCGGAISGVPQRVPGCFTSTAPFNVQSLSTKPEVPWCVQEELEARKLAAEAERRARQAAMREEVKRANFEQLRLKAAREEEMRAQEAVFRDKMMAKFAEDDRIEQLNAQKRRMKVSGAWQLLLGGARA
jgi:Trichohyalin-plectin-homology domain